MTTRTHRLLPLLALALAACGENRSSISILGRAAPQDLTTCTFMAGGENQLGPGVLDVAYADRLTYSTVVYVKNNLVDPAETGGFTAAKAWTPYAAKVRVNPRQMTEQFGPGGLLPFSGGNTLSLDGQAVEVNASTAQYVDIVGRTLGQQLADAGVAPGERRRILVGVSLQGRTQDGAFLETEEWPFSIDVCNGCLVNPAAGAPPACPTGTTLALTNCFGLGQDTTPACTSTAAQ